MPNLNLHHIYQGCGLSLDVSVSRRTNVSSRSRLDQNAQCLSLLSVSDLCVSDLVSVSTQNISASRLGPRTILSCRDVSCRRAQLNYNSPMKTSRPMPYSIGRVLGTVCVLTFPLLIPSLPTSTETMH